MSIFTIGLLAACGGNGAADPTTTVPPGETPTAVPGETPPATATATPSTSDLPAPDSPVGTIVFAELQVGPGAGLPRNSAPRGLGITEMLFAPGLWPDERDQAANPWIAEGFSFSDDLSTFTLTIKQGIEFHGGYGELTAEDVAWTLNETKADITPDSIASQSGDHRALFDGAWRVVDEYTVEVDLHLADPRIPAWNLGEGFQGPAIISKAHFDERGEAANDRIIGTGPFSVVRWVPNDIVEAERVENHYRKTADAERIVIRQIAEAATRVASLQTGAVDVADIPLHNLTAQLDRGFDMTTTGFGFNTGIFWPGNLWETHDFQTGEELSREGLRPELPWIGDPVDDESMESARKVRWALGLALDREAIIDVTQGGHGYPVDMSWYDPGDANYKTEEWHVGYDEERALQYLEDAGWANGFDITLYAGGIGGAVLEIGDAMAGMWEQVGVRTTVDKSDYSSTYRPGVVARTESNPWVATCDEGRSTMPFDFPSGLVMTSLTRGGFGCGNESAYIAERFLAAVAETDYAARVAIVTEVADYIHHWSLATGVVHRPTFRVFNPRSIESWDQRMSFDAQLNAMENIVLAQR